MDVLNELTSLKWKVKTDILGHVIDQENGYQVANCMQSNYGERHKFNLTEKEYVDMQKLHAHLISFAPQMLKGLIEAKYVFEKATHSYFRFGDPFILDKIEELLIDIENF